MTKPWNEGVRGTQVLPLINLDASTIRGEAGPGTGKTFGLVGVFNGSFTPKVSLSGSDVPIVAFNRVIAKQLQDGNR